MLKEKEQEELWFQKEVIEFIRCVSSTFLTAKRYEKLRANHNHPSNGWFALSL